MTQLTTVRTATVITLDSHGMAKTQDMINQINRDLRAIPEANGIRVDAGFLWPTVTTSTGPEVWKRQRITIIVEAAKS